jgi:hypothetical protein
MNETGASRTTTRAPVSNGSPLLAAGAIARHCVALVVIGLALLGAGLLPAARSAAQAGTPTSAGQTLHFDVQFQDTFLTADPAALALGDRVILSDLLLSNGKEAGRNAGVCTVTDVAGEMICSVVYTFPDGQIATQFFNTPPPEKAFAIVGGTGRYLGAHGFGELVEHGDEAGTVTFHLTD